MTTLGDLFSLAVTLLFNFDGCCVRELALGTKTCVTIEIEQQETVVADFGGYFFNY